MTTTEFLKQATTPSLIDLLEEAHKFGNPVTVKGCSFKITRPAILRELVNRKVVISISTK